MCPSSPSAWQIWSWADPFPSLSKKLFYFVKKGCCKQPQKEIGVPERGRLSLFFCNIQPSMPPRWDGNGHSAPCRPVIDRLSRSGLFSGRHPEQQELFCAKIIEACRTQDCRLNRRPEKVLNIMLNAPAKPLCKGPRAAFLPLHCPPRRSNALCHKVHFRNGKFFVIPQRPQLRTKNGQTKAGCAPKDTPCQFI